MRRIGHLLCALFAVASTQEAVPAASPEPTLYPREESAFSWRFKVSTTPGAKPPQPVRGEVRPPTPAEIRTPRSRVVCGIKMIEGDPSVDSRMVIPIPKAETAKIRVIAPPPCDRMTPGPR